MSYSEVGASKDKIYEIIREIEGAKSEHGLVLDEAYRELAKAQTAFISRIKELHKDLYPGELFTELFPAPIPNSFKDMLKKLLDENPHGKDCQQYINRCNKYIALYDKMKTAEHIKYNVNYDDMYKGAYLISQNSAMGGEVFSKKRGDGDDDIEAPMNYGTEQPMPDENQGEVLIPVNTMTISADIEQPINDVNGDMKRKEEEEKRKELEQKEIEEKEKRQREEDERKKKKEEEEKRKILEQKEEAERRRQREEDERKRKKEEEEKRKKEEQKKIEDERKKKKEEEEEKRKKLEQKKIEEEKRKREEEEKRKKLEQKKIEEEEERKRKKEQEKLSKLYKDEFFCVITKERKLPETNNEIRQLLFEKCFFFSKEVFDKIFSSKVTDKQALEKIYGDTLIESNARRIYIYEYPANIKQDYPKGMVSRNIFNGRTVKRDVIHFYDAKCEEAKEWISANRDCIQKVETIKFYYKKISSYAITNELKTLRSSDDDVPLWYISEKSYPSNNTLIIATTSDKPPKCSDNFLSIETKDIIDKFVNKKLEPISYTEIDIKSCKYGNSCVLFMDNEHMKEYSHPHDANICPNILFCTRSEWNMTHICKDGLRCPKRKDPAHCKYNIHIQTCDDRLCRETSLVHKICGHPGTVTKRDTEKVEKLSLCSCDNINTTRGWKEAVVPNFDLNMAVWMERCKAFIGKSIETRNYNFKTIASWFAGLLPVHLCPGSGFAGIVKMGAITSLDTLVNMWISPPNDIYKYMLCNKEFKNFADSIRDIDKFYNYITRYCRLKFMSIRDKMSKDNIKKIEKQILAGVPVEIFKFSRNVFFQTPSLTKDEERALEKATERLEKKGFKDFAGFDKALEEYASLLSSIIMDVKPIEFGVDKEIGTDKHVFAIQGYNTGNYGNGEVAIVFKRCIMKHPDFFMTPVAAMGYYQGWYCFNTKLAIDRRPWMGEAKGWERGGRQDYLESMFQLGTKDWPKACAMEWIARVHKDKGTDPNRVSLKDIQDMISGADPHTAIESHLPSFVPLDYIERVYIKKGVINYSTLDIVKKHGVEYNEVDEPKRAVIDAMSRIKAVLEGDMKGYSFAMPTDREIHIPVDLGSIKAIDKISFTALSETRKKKDGIIIELRDFGKEAKSVMFRNDHVVAHADSDVISDESLDKCVSCDSEYPIAVPSMGIHFAISIDNIAKQCTITHSSLCGVHKFSVPLKFKPRMMTLYGITDFTYPVTFDSKDVTAHYTPIQDSTNGPKSSPSAFGSGSTTSKPSTDALSRSTQKANYDDHHADFNREFGFVEKSYHGTLCKDPVYCLILEKHNDKSHENTYVHVCKYGKTCRDISNYEHKKHFVHLDKPTCSEGSKCQNDEPQHRSDYHHPGSWDYLIPCLANGCKDRSHSHCARYQHGSKIYPLIKKK